MLRDFPLVDAPRSFLDPQSPAVPVRNAATVMLVRPASDPAQAPACGSPGPHRAGPGTPGGVEVFTIRRIRRMAFAGGMLVFPGGAVEERDADPRLPWHGPAPSEVAAALSAPEPLARAVVVAAVRETFEECGVLLAGPADDPARPLPLRPDAAHGTSAPGGDAWEERRQALLSGRASLADVLLEAGLVLRAELLHPWAHWITPPFEPRRFDTRFFAAALPAGQHARYLAGEAAAASWVRPAAALADRAAGRLPMLPPTTVMLEDLAAAPSLPVLLATTRRVRPVTPWLVRTGPEGATLRVDLDGVGGGEPGPAGGPA
ncbi:MAG TPA: NUDIX hydrolase [Kineosporiaceae bacterium]